MTITQIECPDDVLGNMELQRELVDVFQRRWIREAGEDLVALCRRWKQREANGGCCDVMRGSYRESANAILDSYRDMKAGR